MFNSEKDFLKEARPLAESLIAYAMTAGKPFGISDVKIAISASTCQVSVTIYAGDRTLSFTRNTLDQSTLCAAVLQNMQVIHMVPENKDKRLLEANKVFKGPRADLDLHDKKQPEQKDLIAYIRQVEAAALAQPGVKGTRSVSITKSNSHFLILATNGLDRHESSTGYQASANVIAEDASGMQIDGDYSAARHFSDMSNPVELGKSAGQGAVKKLGGTLPLTGKMPIVLNHDAAESFFANVYAAIRGTHVHRGTTFLKDKIGQQVMSKGITLVDDPGIARGISSSQVDSAGLETKKIAFVEDGVLKSYNLNLLES